MKKIAIIGAGPIGLTLAAHLKTSGNYVILCDVSQNIKENVEKNGIKIVGVKELHEYPDEFLSGVDELAVRKPDIIFIAVKATALPLICSAIKDFYEEGMTIVSWQNGIDTERVIADSLGEQAVLRGVINHGVSFKESGEVFMAFENAPHYIQEMDNSSKETAKDVAKILSESGLITERSDNLIKVVWAKTILNGATNALCGLTGMNLKESMSDPYAMDLCENLVKESIKVARANEIMLGWEYFRKSMILLSNLGPHKPSMLLDIEAKRRTEIDFINGKIKDYGNYAGIETPYNNTLISLIKSKEKTILKDR